MERTGLVEKAGLRDGTFPTLVPGGQPVQDAEQLTRPSFHPAVLLVTQFTVSNGVATGSDTVNVVIDNLNLNYKRE